MPAVPVILCERDLAGVCLEIRIYQRWRLLAQTLLGFLNDPRDNYASWLDCLNDARPYPSADIHHAGIATLCRLHQLLAQFGLLRHYLALLALPRLNKRISQYPIGDPLWEWHRAHQVVDRCAHCI